MKLSVAQIDHKKAFDRVPHSGVIKCVDPYKITQWYLALYNPVWVNEDQHDTGPETRHPWNRTNKQ